MSGILLIFSGGRRDLGGWVRNCTFKSMMELLHVNLLLELEGLN